MTISAETLRRTEYSGSGNTGPFAIVFSIDASTELTVIQTASGVDTSYVLDTDYTVSEDLTEITLTTALESGERLVILGNTPMTQEIEYIDFTKMPAENTEVGLDKLTKIVIEQQEMLARAVTLAPSSLSEDITLGTPTANYYLTWNASATAITSVAGLLPSDGDKGDITVSGTGTVWTIDSDVISTYGRSLIVANAASNARTTLGLGTIATQNSNGVSITGGSIAGITDLAIADGGTGSSTAVGARSALGLEIGVDVQAYSSALDAVSGTNTGDQNIFTTIAVSGQSNVVADDPSDTLTLVAGSNITITTDASTDTITIASTASGVSDGDKGDITVSASGATWTIDNDAVTYAKIQDISATDILLGRSTAGAGIIEEIACTAAGRALLDDANASAQRTTLGLGTISTQASSSVSITGGSISGITDLAVADGGTGASTAADARTNLGLVIGTDVQAYNSELDDFITLFSRAAGGQPQKFVFWDSVSHNVTLQAPSTISTTYSFHLPVDGGTSGYVLSTDGTGVTSWVAQAGSPAGSDTQVQFNDSSSFGGDSGLTYNKTTDVLTVAGGINIGTADTMVVNGSTITANLQINSDTQAIDEIHTHSDTAASGAVRYFARSRGTEASPTVVSSGDTVGTIAAVGYDGTDYALGARIDFVIGTTPGTNDMPTNILFKVSADGSQSPTTAVTVNYTGNVDFAAGVDVTGDVTSTTGFYVGANAAYISAGTDVAVTDGGTGASTAADARTNLGLAIGTNVQAYDADLTDLATQWTPASASGAASLIFLEDTDNGTDKVTLAGPSAITTSYTFTLPSDAGTNGYVLQTNGSGTTSWVAQSGGGSVNLGITTLISKGLF